MQKSPILIAHSGLVIDYASYLMKERGLISTGLVFEIMVKQAKFIAFN